MCTKILLAELERMNWNGQDALEGPDDRLSFYVAPWTKGLAVELRHVAGKRETRKTIVLRRGQELKLIRSMLKVWVSRHPRLERTSWLDKKIDSSTRIGPNVQQFVNAVMSRYKDGDVVAKERALDDLRRAVRRAQASGLTEHELKLAWDEGLFEQMLQA